MNIGSQRNTILFVSTFTALGLILRFYFALTLPVGWDGGIFLYWANLINGGAIPYRDFFIRDPVYIYLLAAVTRILGPTYFALSLLSVIPGAASVPVIYKVSRNIFDKGSGLVAAAIYSIAPTIIWHSTVFDERTLMLFLSACALWMLVKGVKSQASRYFIAYGLILGVSTFAYRGIAIYIVTMPILFAYLYLCHMNVGKKDLRLFLTRSLESILAFALAGGLVFAYFSLNSSLSWMLSNFGFGGQQESASYFIYGEVAVLSDRGRIFDVFVREWLYLIVPAGLATIVLTLGRFIKKRIVLVIAGIIVSSFLVTAVTWLTYFPQSSSGAYEPSDPYATAYLVFLVLLPSFGGALLPDIARRATKLRQFGSGPVVAVFWLLSTALLVALFGVPIVNYYYYFAPVMTILSSLAIRIVLGHLQFLPRPRLPRPSRNSMLGLAFLGLLVLNAAFTTGMLLSTEMTWRNQSLASVHDIASYIQANTTPQDQVLVGNPAIAQFAQRKVALGITQLQIYGKNGPEPYNPMPYDPFHLFPSVSQIAQFMDQGRVKYVVADNSPPVLSIMSLHPLWESAFVTNFVLETTIDGIPIFRYSPTWDLSQHLDDVVAYSNSTSYSLHGETWTDGFGHTIAASAATDSLPTVGGSIRPNQIEFTPPIPAGVSFIQINLMGGEYVNLTTSFALADSAVGNSSGVNYSVHVYVGNQQTDVVNSFVTSNTWQQNSIPLPASGANLTIVLSSGSTQSSAYDWLQLTLTLQR